MYQLTDFHQPTNPLADEYRLSQVDVRILLTGHSHQASPDCCLRAQSDAWMSAARHVEARWEEAFEKAARVREGFAGLIHCAPERLALASSVHDFVGRFLSALPLRHRNKLVTTGGEHPSVNRQLMRFKEAGFDVQVEPVQPLSTLVERLCSRVDNKTAAVFISSVFFETGETVPELDTLMPVCQRWGAELFVDAYQSINVQPFSIADYNLEQAFVAGGGTKYCQLGDGVAFMHVPEGCTMRPLLTGWFGTFDALVDNPAALPVSYGDDHALFDGSSYDPTAHYRAVEVFAFFRDQGLDVELLQDINQHQIDVLVQAFTLADLDPRIIRLTAEPECFGGFISFVTPHAQRLCTMLRDIGVHTDYRRQWLRMGPAPYVSNEQLLDAIEALGEAVARLPT